MDMNRKLWIWLSIIFYIWIVFWGYWITNFHPICVMINSLLIIAFGSSFVFDLYKEREFSLKIAKENVDKDIRLERALLKNRRLLANEKTGCKGTVKKSRTRDTKAPTRQ